MTAWSRFAKRGFLLGVFLAMLLGPLGRGLGSGGTVEPANQGEQTGTILSVRKVLRNQYFTSRYPQIHYYILYISLRDSDQIYCTEYETPVLDEIADVNSATSHEVSVVVKGKTITLRRRDASLRPDWKKEISVSTVIE